MFRRTLCAFRGAGQGLVGLYGRSIMQPKQFRQWRKSMDLKQKEAAELLGLNKRMIQYYEKGERDGKAVQIPKYIRLACYALEKRVKDFDGEKVTQLDD